LQDELKQSNQQMAEYKDQVESFSLKGNKEVELKDSEVRDFKNKLKEVENRNESLNSQINLLNKTLNSIKFDSNEKISKIQEQLDKQNSLYNEYYLKFTSSQTVIDNLKDELMISEQDNNN